MAKAIIKVWYVDRKTGYTFGFAVVSDNTGFDLVVKNGDIVHVYPNMRSANDHGPDPGPGDGVCFEAVNLYRGGSIACWRLEKTAAGQSRLLARKIEILIKYPVIKVQKMLGGIRMIWQKEKGAVLTRPMRQELERIKKLLPFLNNYYPAKDCVMIGEPLRQGRERIMELLAVLKNYYPVLEYIPVFNDSLPDILNVRSSIGPRDGYEKIILAKYKFNGCVIDACIGSFAKDVPIWHLIKIKIEWREQMLNISGDEPVDICFERLEISMLFSADELRRKKCSGEFLTENELAELEYYQDKAEEIIKQATQELRERIIWPEKLLLNGGSDCSNLQEWL